MTRAEAIAAVEALFTVHHEAGLEIPYRDQTGAVYGTASMRDMDLAPCGEPYVVVTSNGFRGDAEDVFFCSDSMAMRWWKFAVEAYAESIAPQDEWKSLHLYWRDYPRFECATYLAADQAALLQTKSPLSACMHIDVGVVFSRMLITRTNPDGKAGA